MPPRGAWILEVLALILAIALLVYRLRKRATVVDDRQGFGRRIVVRDRGRFRELVFTSADGTEEMLQASVAREGRLVSGVAYTDGLHLAAIAAPRLDRAIFLGGGPILAPRQLLEISPDVEVSVVELDPAVVHVARAHFGVEDTPRLSIEIGDGRAAIARAAPASLDVIVVDAFGVGTTPRRLSSAPFFALCRDRLRPGGRLVVNFAGPLVGPEGKTHRRIYAGVVEAFGEASVAAFGVPSATSEDPADADNSLALAVRDAPVPSPSALADRAAGLPRGLFPHLGAILDRRFAVDLDGVVPIADPAGGQDDALSLW